MSIFLKYSSNEDDKNQINKIQNQKDQNYYKLTKKYTTIYISYYQKIKENTKSFEMELNDVLNWLFSQKNLIISNKIYGWLFQN